MSKENEKNDKLKAMRHSCEHVLTMAMMRLWPGKIKAAMGPAIEDGFYFDFDSDIKISKDGFGKIEKEMTKIIKEDLPITKDEMTVAKARKFFSGNTYKDNQYKHEWIDEIEERKEKVAVYWMGKKGQDMPGTFADICSGPHVKSTKEIGPFKLLSLAGAYWRGSEKNKMLQRIYGTCFETQKELENYLHMQEEAKKRDHRELGKRLDLFVFSEKVGPGLPLYTFKGACLRKTIQDYSNQLRKEMGYEEVYTPNMNKAELFKISGHYQKFKGDMFKVVSNYTKEEYFLKPMNCPQHTQIFASKMRSYKDLPIRIADFANLYRDEKPGELNGLVRLRAFVQDDGHCFCREDQIKEEFEKILRAVKQAMRTYKMEYYIRFSLWDEEKKEKYLGDAEVWEKSQKLMEELLVKNKIEYIKVKGEAAFYGPKMDLMAKDSLGREWQLSTIQLDFNMPARFKLEYIDNEGKKQTPVMIHSAIVGSPERFMGCLIEHYAGAFPVWLSPVQVKVLTISPKHVKYSQKVLKELKDNDIRAELDDAEESVGKKIRNAEIEKVPYILIIGDKEVSSKKVALRVRGKGDKGAVNLAKFIKEINEQIADKK